MAMWMLHRLFDNDRDVCELMPIMLSTTEIVAGKFFKHDAFFGAPLAV